jgi:hypothetical protein
MSKSSQDLLPDAAGEGEGATEEGREAKAASPADADAAEDAKAEAAVDKTMRWKSTKWGEVESFTMDEEEEVAKWLEDAAGTLKMNEVAKFTLREYGEEAFVVKCEGMEGGTNQYAYDFQDKDAKVQHGDAIKASGNAWFKKGNLDRALRR